MTPTHHGPPDESKLVRGPDGELRRDFDCKRDVHDWRYIGRTSDGADAYQCHDCDLVRCG